MKEEWVKPVVTDLKVSDTEHSPNIATNVDGQFTDPNGNLWTSYS